MIIQCDKQENQAKQHGQQAKQIIVRRFHEEEESTTH